MRIATLISWKLFMKIVKVFLVLFICVILTLILNMDKSYIKIIKTFQSDVDTDLESAPIERKCLSDDPDLIPSFTNKKNKGLPAIDVIAPGSVFWVDRKNNSVYIGEITEGGLFSDAPSSSVGSIWPEPKYYKNRPGKTTTDTDDDEVHILDKDNFSFRILPKLAEPCYVIQSAMDRYTKEIKDMTLLAETVECENQRKLDKNKMAANVTSNIDMVALVLDGTCENDYPSIDMDESYTIKVVSGFAIIAANESWGLLRGMESFYQLLYITKTDHNVYINSTEIIDKPVFKHRGLLIDTARHFIPVPVIKTNLDAMAQNKMNVFHWHIIDDQSFPFKSERLPELWKMGAYSLNKLYSHEDVNDIIEYARDRGIRVIPEIDTPGHTYSWARTADIHLYCGDTSPGMIDITNPKALQVIKVLFTEIRELFKDRSIHIGADEVPSKCLYMNNNTRLVLNNTSHQDLLQDYFTGLFKVLHDIDPEWEVIAWEEMLKQYKVKLNTKYTMIQPWINIISHQIAESQGYNHISSVCWYLDNPKNTWMKLYDCDLLQRQMDPGAFGTKHFMGGEACMWSELVDETNIVQTIWPRAAAVAERLWSYGKRPHENGTTSRRFHEQNCRMKRRGIPAAPLTGAGSCQ